MKASFRFGIVVGILAAVSCASVSFPYHWYGLDAKDYDGSLLGPTAADDIPMATCSPLPNAPGQCVVFKSSEFFKLKQDYEQMQLDLQKCQNP